MDHIDMSLLEIRPSPGQCKTEDPTLKHHRHHIRARAEIKTGKAADLDDIVNEMIKTMPYESILDIAEDFDEMFDPDNEENIPQWKCTDYVGMRKNPEATNLKDYRWLAKLDQFRQWYKRTWRRWYEERPKTEVRTYGLEKDKSCDDIVTIIKDIITKAAIWDKNQWQSE